MLHANPLMTQRHGLQGSQTVRHTPEHITQTGASGVQLLQLHVREHSLQLYEPTLHMWQVRAVVAQLGLPLLEMWTQATRWQAARMLRAQQMPNEPVEALKL